MPLQIARRASCIASASVGATDERRGRAWGTVASASRDLRPRGRARPGYSRVAGHGYAVPIHPARRNALQLLVGQLAFGDLTREESLKSIGLFASEVMPVLRAKVVAMRARRPALRRVVALISSFSPLKVSRSRRLSTMESSRVRLAADVGGLHGCRRVRRDDGELKLGKTLTTPVRLVDGIENGSRRRARAFAPRVCSCMAPRLHQHHPGAHRRKVPLLTTQGFATSTRSAVSTGRNPTICFFTGTSR